MQELAEFIEDNYGKACAMQRDLHARYDGAMLAALGEGTLGRAAVIGWMGEYNLWRGVNAPTRRRVAGRFMSFAARTRPRWFRQPAVAERLCVDLHLTLAPGSGERKWLSAASKLLWLLYPSRVPMYDTQVHTSLCVLGKLHPVLLEHAQLGAAPQASKGESGQNAAERYGGFYMRYYAMTTALLEDRQEQLAGLRAANGETYPYDIRILDKLLWLMGKG